MIGRICLMRRRRCNRNCGSVVMGVCAWFGLLCLWIQGKIERLDWYWDDCKRFVNIFTISDTQNDQSVLSWAKHFPHV